MGAVSVDFYHDSEGFSFSVSIHTGEGRSAAFNITGADFTGGAFNAAWQALYVADAFDLEDIAVMRFTREGRQLGETKHVECEDLATSSWTLLADKITEVAAGLRDA